jgi:hypothetical protein
MSSFTDTTNKPFEIPKKRNALIPPVAPINFGWRE